MVKNSFLGNQYLRTNDYYEGERSFRTAVAQNPYDPLANYYLGRFLLAQKEPAQALPYLRMAVAAEPRDTEYLFWQGVAYGALGEKKREQESYQKVIVIDTTYVQAWLYLGHNQMEQEDFEGALVSYQKVLGLRPYNASALYNRALIAKILEQRPEEKAGWLSYLNKYPAGDFAIQAIYHLNALGEFSYRNQYLSGRTVPLPRIKFEPFSGVLERNSLPSLDIVGATASNMGQGKLQILVFQENNKRLAKTRAISTRDYLVQKFPGLTTENTGISWFGEPELVALEGEKISVPSSVRFFITGIDTTNTPSVTKK
jgi:tetratricopeptide (TPR) repeat protein